MLAEAKASELAHRAESELHLLASKPSYYESLPAKRMGAGALFFDEDRHVLLVEPTYKEYWEIPGGVVEKNESPFQACIREVKEELGLVLHNHRLLCIDYNSAQADKTESLMFIFLGGTLNSTDIGKIQYQEVELKGFQFVSPFELSSFLPKMLYKRVEQCLKAIELDQTLYLENQAMIEVSS